MFEQGSDQQSSPQPSLCGFHRCQEPLPPPGPRGGRPYEFCPEKNWPGGKSCKQLAAAEQALREALGEEAAPAGALQEAGDAFSRAAAAVTEPLRMLNNALDAITARLHDEVSATAARADVAERAARDAERERDEALDKASLAEQAERAADDRARAASQAQEVAEAAADEAVTARAAAEVKQARAEAVTAAITEQAEQLAADVAVERARADDVTATVATRTEELAVRTAERDATRAALDALRAHSGTLEQVLNSQNADLGSKLEAAQAQLRQNEERNQALIVEHREREAELWTRIGQARADVARAQGQLETAGAEVRHLTGQYQQVSELLAHVRLKVVEPQAAPPTSSLRDDLLAILLGDAVAYHDEATPESAPDPHPNVQE